MILSSFKGGIYPSPNKRLTLEKKFFNLSIPHTCIIPLKQHTGIPARPVVKAGDLIREGQLIGRADGIESSNIHSSIPGKVIDIVEHQTDSGKSVCIVIEADGIFSTSGKIHEPVNWQNINKDILLERIIEAGITDTSDDTISIAQKLRAGEGKKFEYLIISACESEPYLTTFNMLIKTYPEEIIEGLLILLKILDIEKAYIGIENKKLPAIKKFREIIEKSSSKENIQLVPLKPKYPAEDERMLIHSILKKDIPTVTDPSAAGIAVLSVTTLFSIREAVLFNKPFFECFITISGKIVKNPGNYKIRVGTRILDILDECGGLRELSEIIIMGGPMRGKAVSWDVPVVKGTRGILFLSKKEVRLKNNWPCIRCGRCIAVCPIRLLPYKTAKTGFGTDDFIRFKLNECTMCGSCSYVCPSKIPLTHLIQANQDKLQERKNA